MFKVRKYAKICITIIWSSMKLSLFVVMETHTHFSFLAPGGSIGREGDHDVLLDDEVGCSKIHARYAA